MKRAIYKNLLEWKSDKRLFDTCFWRHVTLFDTCFRRHVTLFDTCFFLLLYFLYFCKLIIPTMKRAIYKNLLEWKNDKRRKPLLLQGARQVGKTYLVKEFGKTEYKELIYLNFEKNPKFSALFNDDLDPYKLIEKISLSIARKISPKNTLIFFDEIQESERAITSLKYFNELAPEFHIIAAGSLLGVSINRESAFPVGNVNFMTLYPMSFMEYLDAFDMEFLSDSIQNKTNFEKFPEMAHKELIKHFKKYLFLGGMPEVLKVYKQETDVKAVRKIQTEIIKAYKRDFSKYVNKDQAIKNLDVWESIPYQLAKENKKFQYSQIKQSDTHKTKKKRAGMYRDSILWLQNAGLINVVYNISTPKIPLNGHSNQNIFKIYMFDTGLLVALLEISSDIILNPTRIFKEYNGAFIENFVASELTIYKNKKLHYWTSGNQAKVDFIIDSKDEIYPIEVKSGLSKNKKSLKSYEDKYNPKLIYRLSPRNFIKEDKFINIPLYAVSFLKNQFE